MNVRIEIDGYAISDGADEAATLFRVVCPLADIRDAAPALVEAGFDPATAARWAGDILAVADEVEAKRGRHNQMLNIECRF